jgi:hypothetical protein
MRTIPLLACLMTATTAIAANRIVASAQSHLPQPQRTDCPYPWCDQTPRLYRLAAPDDPSSYLGDRISYERPSNWRDFAPVREVVDTLSGAAVTDREKITAIADWVKRSKLAGDHQYEDWPPSIIDIWGFPAMRCEEASFLLTGMLRLAGIPAMRFTTWNNAHAAVRAYLGGQWIVVDATPTEPDNSGPARIYAADDPAVIPAFQERPILTMTGLVVPGSNEHVDTFTLFSYEPLNEAEKLAAVGLSYARVALPVTNQFLYYDPEARLFINAGTPDQRVTIGFRIEAVDDGCLNGQRSWYAAPINTIVPGPMWRTTDHVLPSWVGQFYPVGYEETILPTCGTWRVSYAFSSDALNAMPSALAYADVQLANATDVVVVRPAMLQPEAGADLYTFHALVDALGKLPSYEQLASTTTN